MGRVYPELVSTKSYNVQECKTRKIVLYLYFYFNVSNENRLDDLKIIFYSYHRFVNLQWLTQILLYAYLFSLMTYQLMVYIVWWPSILSWTKIRTVVHRFRWRQLHTFVSAVAIGTARWYFVPVKPAQRRGCVSSFSNIVGMFVDKLSPVRAIARSFTSGNHCHW